MLFAVVVLILALLFARAILSGIADFVRGTFLFTRGALNIVNRTPPRRSGRLLPDNDYRELLIDAGAAPRFVHTASAQELDYIGSVFRVSRSQVTAR